MPLDPPTLPQRTAFQSLLRWLPLMMLVLGAALTWSILQVDREQNVALEQTRFEARAREVISGIDRRLQNNAALLRGVAGLFTSSDNVTRDEFRRYVGSLQLQANYAGIQGVGYSRWLQPAEVAPYIAQTRAEGFHDFNIRPAEQRERWSSIAFLEPFDWRNRRAFGYDMFSEPTRQQAMRQAVETGEPALSSMITLVQETEKDVQPGFLMYLPIYRRNATLATASDRWAALEGWAYSPLRAHDLVNTLMAQDFPALRDHFALQIYATPQADPAQRLYDGWNNLPPDSPQMEQILDTHGSRWLIRVAALKANWPENPPASMVWTLITGATITLLLATLTEVMLRHQIRTQQHLAWSVNTNRLLAAQQAQLKLAGTVMEASPLGIMVTDAQHRIVSINPAFTRITGYDSQEALSQTPHTLLAGASLPDPYAATWTTLQTQGHWEGELQSRHKDGHLYPAFLSMTRVSGSDGKTVNHVGLFQDITERRQSEDRIRQLAHHDYLTGLANRALLVERATQELRMAQRYGRRPAILFMDMDRFKPVNDTYGHEAGDAVLIEVAQRLTHMLRGSDLVCRQGGDEFVVLVMDHAGTDSLLHLAEKLIAAIEEPIVFGEHSITLSASIGVATYPEHGETVDALINSADAAMYLAKQHPSERVSLARVAA